MSSSEIIIIGAGHNGLVTAGYLAKAGLKPVVLERRAVAGGAFAPRHSLKPPALSHLESSKIFSWRVMGLSSSNPLLACSPPTLMVDRFAFMKM
jgi:2-polyprenyl-6-methoxyphenol hydroxylase-like FAD-dependent oxidoreductase